MSGVEPALSAPGESDPFPPSLSERMTQFNPDSFMPDLRDTLDLSGGSKASTSSDLIVKSLARPFVCSVAGRCCLAIRAAVGYCLEMKMTAAPVSSTMSSPSFHQSRKRCMKQITSLGGRRTSKRIVWSKSTNMTC